MQACNACRCVRVYRPGKGKVKSRITESLPGGSEGTKGIYCLQLLPKLMIRLPSLVGRSEMLEGDVSSLVREPILSA